MSRVCGSQVALTSLVQYKITQYYTNNNVNWLLFILLCMYMLIMRALKQGNNNETDRKTEQHNTTHPKQSYFKEKVAASGGIQTCNTRILGYTLTN